MKVSIAGVQFLGVGAGMVDALVVRELGGGDLIGL